LFLAALGVVSQGLTLDKGNPAASVFQLAAGNLGYRFFGIVLWAAAITSVVGSAYTSVSFLCTLSKTVNDRSRWFIIGFIIFSTLVFLAVGEPVKILIMAGAVNGLILPIALTIILIAAYRPNLVGQYRHPLWMTLCGVLVVLAMTVLVGVSFYKVIQPSPKVAGTLRVPFAPFDPQTEETLNPAIRPTPRIPQQSTESRERLQCG
jgi:Mn2+/Fe2+ NRAMP family transporter